MSSKPKRSEAKSQLITRFKQRDYEVLLINEPDHPGYSILCPELGSASQGDHKEEALEMIAEAISLFLDDYINEGQEPPLKPGAMAETVAEYEAEGCYETEQAKVRPLDWDEMTADCDKALAENAEDVGALIRRGGAFLSKNDNQWAMDDYTAAIAMAPENAEADHGRAERPLQPAGLRFRNRRLRRRPAARSTRRGRRGRPGKHLHRSRETKARWLMPPRVPGYTLDEVIRAFRTDDQQRRQRYASQ